MSEDSGCPKMVDNPFLYDLRGIEVKRKGFKEKEAIKLDIILILMWRPLQEGGIFFLSSPSNMTNK